MSFLDKISKAFMGTETPSRENGVWNLISTSEEIEELMLISYKRTQVIYKHSSSCGISFFAMRSLNIPEVIENENIDLHIIDVIRHRTISHDFAEKVSVRHESPQVFVIKNGEIEWHGSHNSVNSKNILDHI